MKADNENHAEIYLQPPGTAEDPDTGRLWCQDDAPFDCEDDDGNVVPWVRYVRSDIHDALAARLAEAERVLRICANYPPAGMRPQDAKPFFAGFIPAEQRAAREYFAARAAVSAVVAQEPKP